MSPSKLMIGLTATALALAFAPASFAQVQLSISNTPSAFEISSSHHAMVSDPGTPGNGITITGSNLMDSGLDATMLVLTFPGPITSGVNNLNVPNATEEITIAEGTGLFNAETAIDSINFAAGTITISLPIRGSNDVSGSFVLKGIRIDVNGRTAPLSLISATLTNGGANYLPPASMPLLISALGNSVATLQQATLASPATDKGKALIYSNRLTITDTRASVLLTEGQVSAWRTAAQNSNFGITTNITSTEISLTVAGLPAGLTATFAQVINGISPTITLSNGGAVTSVSPKTVVTFVATNMTILEQLAFDITLSGAPTGSLPLAAGPITVVADNSPIGTAFTGGLPHSDLGFPTFNASPTSAVVVGDIVLAQTTMLIPYMVNVGQVFDTGLAISNTTADPFGEAGGAAPQSGAFTVWMFKANPDGSVSALTPFTTSGSLTPGTPGPRGGLDVNGKLAAGGTWTVLASQLVAAAGVPGDFTGYVFLQADFTNAHGISYILSGPGLGTVSATSPVNVIRAPSLNSRNTTDAEQLNF